MKGTNRPAIRTRHFFAAVAVMISFGAYAQESPDGENTERDIVMYDPLFWKDELSLRSTQSKKIEAINTEFYENLRHMKDESANQPEMHEQLERGLQERSQKIYETLLPKQRRKLEKIIDKTGLVTAP